MRHRPEVIDSIQRVGIGHCAISEITLMELYYGAECSKRVEDNIRMIDQLMQWIKVVPITNSIREMCHCKAILRKQGQMVEDNDLLIGCTAKVNGYVMVTENVKHLQHIPGLVIENWVQR